MSKNVQILVDWAKPYLSRSRRLRYIMDQRLVGHYSVKGAKEMALLALQCISLNPKDRPRMPAIILTLEALLQNKDMAISCGQWPVFSKSTKNNGVSVSAAKLRVEYGGGVQKISTSATPNWKA
ncbi:hypothetical protein CRYUN_Cryun23aG0168200 [Craigia yunnanensis]